MIEPQRGPGPRVLARVVLRRLFFFRLTCSYVAVIYAAYLLLYWRHQSGETSMARLQLGTIVVATCIALIGAGGSAPAQQAVNPSLAALDANAQAQIAAQFPNVVYKPGQVIWMDQANGPICAGPIGAGPCAAVWQWMAAAVLSRQPQQSRQSQQPQQPQPTPSVFKNPGQAWGGSNSVFNNPAPYRPGLVEERPWGFCPPPCVLK
jgi:hypothetical protein